MAESGDFYISKKPKPAKLQSSYLLADILYDDIIKYSGREGGTYKISPTEKKYFWSRRDYYTKRLQAENARIKADPKYQLQKQKEEEQDLVRNLRWAKRELESAKRDNDTNRIEYWTKAIQNKEQQLIEFYNQATKEVTEPKENEIKEWQVIPDLDAQIRTIEEPTKDFNEWTVEIGLQESLGEQGGDILTKFYHEKPTLEQIRNDIIKQYKETKARINEEIAIGIIAKSGRDEMVEVAIDNILLR